VTVSDKVEDMNEDPVLNNAAELLGEQAGATAEQITYNVVKAGTTVSYANGTARNQVNTAITLNKIRAVIRTLKANKAKMLTKHPRCSPNYGVLGRGGLHRGLPHGLRSGYSRPLGLHVDCRLRQRKPISDYEFGSVENVRFLTSPDLGVCRCRRRQGQR
jgi:hypothetical protein